MDFEFIFLTKGLIIYQRVDSKLRATTMATSSQEIRIVKTIETASQVKNLINFKEAKGNFIMVK